jgi:hypothetical protein
MVRLGLERFAVGLAQNRLEERIEVLLRSAAICWSKRGQAGGRMPRLQHGKAIAARVAIAM